MKCIFKFFDATVLSKLKNNLKKGHMKKIELELWDKNINFYSGIRPKLTGYILNGEIKRPVVVICPGGGYCELSKREAEPIALQFCRSGFHAFVVWYSVAPNRHPQPLFDVSKAIAIIRRSKKEWNIDPDKIAVCGFSAGGHLASTIGCHWNKSYILDSTDIKENENKPNALILSYPVISGVNFAHTGSFQNLLGERSEPSLKDELSNEKQVGEHTPPTFIWHTLADEIVPMENSLLFASALRQKGISFELHIFPFGRHGLALGTAETAIDNDYTDSLAAEWMNLSTRWLQEIFNKEVAMR